MDDHIFTPTILVAYKFWGFIEPAVSKADEFIVKPAMTVVVPKVMDVLPLGKKDPGASPNPEYTSTAMVQ